MLVFFDYADNILEESNYSFTGSMGIDFFSMNFLCVFASGNFFSK